MDYSSMAESLEKMLREGAKEESQSNDEPQTKKSDPEVEVIPQPSEVALSMGRGSSVVAVLCLFCSGAVSAITQSSSMPMAFERCEEASTQIIAQLNSPPRHVEQLVNVPGARVTRVSLEDSTVLITCDAEEKRVLIERSTERPTP